VFLDELGRHLPLPRKGESVDRGAGHPGSGQCGLVSSVGCLGCAPACLAWFGVTPGR
jgi:hypothetical protein